MAELLGIEKTKKIVHFACGFTEQVVHSTKNGWQLTDVFDFFDEISEIPGVARSLGEVKKEIEDMSPAERIELYEYVRDTFDLPDEKLEAAIEHSLEFALAGYKLYTMWRSVKD